MNELGFINSNSKTKIAKVENTIFENNSNKTEEKDISEYIYMLNLIAPNSKLFFIEKNDPSQVIILNDTDIIKNRKLIKDYRFNEKTKLYELEYKNRKFIRVDPQLRITLKAKTQKTVAFDLGKNEIYKNLIREFNFRTNQFKNRKRLLSIKISN